MKMVPSPFVDKHVPYRVLLVYSSSTGIQQQHHTRVRQTTRPHKISHPKNGRATGECFVQPDHYLSNMSKQSTHVYETQRAFRSLEMNICGVRVAEVLAGSTLLRKPEKHVMGGAFEWGRKATHFKPLLSLLLPPTRVAYPEYIHIYSAAVLLCTKYECMTAEISIL